MDIIAPVPPTPLNVTATTPTQATQNVLQHNLLPHQVIQATVVDVKDRQVLLDMGQQRLRAQTDVEMQSGQKLRLQVVATEPRLELQIMHAPKDNQLLRLLHIYDHRSEVGPMIRALLGQRPAATTAQAAQPGSPATAVAGASPATAAPVANMPGGTAAGGTGGVTAASGAATSQAAAGTATAMPGIQAPAVPAAAPGVTEGINQGATVAAPAAAAAASPAASPTPASETMPAAPGQAPATGLAKPVPMTPADATVLPAAAPHVAPLTAEQRQAVQMALTPQQWNQLEQLSRQLLTSFKDSGGALLFNLARNLGLDFELLLAQEQPELASQSLKGAMLALSEHPDLPEGIREGSQQMVQQLELLQLTRARLAQEGILFLPLPFDFVEQGYALVEQGGGGETPESQSHLVTLHLSLQQLGSVQVNLLFEQQSLYVRILCARPESQMLFEHSKDELQQALTGFSVRSIQVAHGAEDPAVALLHRLQPEHQRVLDERV